MESIAVYTEQRSESAIWWSSLFPADRITIQTTYFLKAYGTHYPLTHQPLTHHPLGKTMANKIEDFLDKF